MNPCADPPGPAGTDLTPPTAQGGALRAQDLRTAGDLVGLDGTVIRIDPDTGAGLPGNPLAGDADPNAARIVADGLRNPFRITSRPGADEMWVGDVGWTHSEEIDVIHSAAQLSDFGWPCYEGAGRQAGYDAANLDVCENLYASSGAVTPPYFSYQHSDRVVPNEGCPVGSSSITGVQFASDGAKSPYPAEYDHALFFSDYSRGCIWAMLAGADGAPSPAQVRTVAAGAARPVNLQMGPGGYLFYVDLGGGTIRRLSYTSGNRPPVAVASATPTSGTAPLTVAFDASGSYDPDAGDVLTYAWDLDGDGVFDDSTAARPTRTYTTPGTYAASLKVSDGSGATATDAVTVSVGNTRPTPSSPGPWRAPRGRWATSSGSPARRRTRRTADCRPRRCPGSC